MDYNKILNSVVIPKLREFGRKINLISKVSNVGDWEQFFCYEQMKYRWKNKITDKVVDALTEIESSESNIEIDALIDNFSSREIDGEFIKAGDVKIYTQTAIKPSTNDFVEFDDKRYIIYHIDVLQPSTVTLLYILYVRTA